jgi:hypothetical protein
LVPSRVNQRVSAQRKPELIEGRGQMMGPARKLVWPLETLLRLFDSADADSSAQLDYLNCTPSGVSCLINEAMRVVGRRRQIFRED